MIPNKDITIEFNPANYYKNAIKSTRFKNSLFIIVRLICLLIVSSFLVFFLIDISPIDPLSSNVGERAMISMSSEKIAQLNEYWNSQTPLFDRYFSWVRSAITGDFGVSTYYGQDVLSIIVDRGTTSLMLLSVSWLLSAILGYVLGLVAGIFKDKLVDKIISGFCWIFAATPQYWIALIAILIFSVNLRIFPVGFSKDIGSLSNANPVEVLYHSVLPIIVLTLTSVSNYCLHTRTKTIDVMNSDYVEFEYSLGKSNKEIIKKHVLRNVNLPAISIAFTQIAEIIGGSVVIETVFSYPGLGNAIINAAIKQDANLLAGITIVMCLIVFVGNAISEIIADKRS